ncbi:conserved hypothetical protein [Candidatus Nitrotoga sp. HW29]|uniref:hypothetical protein n=1 Tax=Candidatus Nitrotoga sp. HW29 TaxID=2886963 RepID=UPI000E3796A7|nr:hypothetical protein [Candidatus Nitrotoga sp. HW29]RFC31734.1 MAG: hypothetical protein DID92_2727745745 [Candidatus Nitrotoga sp. SPKER]CAH1905051.1 conserved hypothetical protein [Candidatus Nitrotoga sp. HW29]
MNTKQINIFIGHDLLGQWFALSPDIPWLAAEGESFAAAREALADIAPGLASMHGIEKPIEIVWHSIHSVLQNGR